jgi:hypothetical protein
LRLIFNSGFYGWPITASVAGSIDRYNPVLAGQEFNCSWFEVFDAAGVSVEHHDRLACAGLNIMHAEAFDRDEMLFDRWRDGERGMARRVASF